MDCASMDTQETTLENGGRDSNALFLSRSLLKRRKKTTAGRGGSQ